VSNKTVVSVRDVEISNMIYALREVSIYLGRKMKRKQIPEN
jgi:hypothetical protein